MYEVVDDADDNGEPESDGPYSGEADQVEAKGDELQDENTGAEDDLQEHEVVDEADPR